MIGRIGMILPGRIGLILAYAILGQRLLKNGG